VPSTNNVTGLSWKELLLKRKRVVKMMNPAGMPETCPACGAMMHNQMLAREDDIIVLVGDDKQGMRMLIAHLRKT